MSERIRVLLADDRVIARLGTAALLGTQPDMEVVGQAEDGVAAINLYRQLKPAVLVLDMKMPALDGLAVTATLMREDPAAKILILSHYDSEKDVVDAFRAGAHGYLSKETSGEDLILAIRTVAAGRKYVPMELAQQLTGGLTSAQLTAREQQVLEQLHLGLTNPQIAAALGISQWTVALHVKNLLSKLGAKTRTEAVSLAVQRGLLGRR